MGAKRRILSLWLPRLATDTALRGRPGEQEDRSRPFALFRDERGRLVVVAVNGAARDQGIHPGMALADARAVLPGLAAEEENPEATARQRDRLVSWCIRFSPWTAPDGPDGVLLDITGCAHLVGGEAELCRELLSRLDGAGFAARAAVADTPAAAWATARFDTKAGIVPPDGQAAVLRALPIAALRLPAETVQGLAAVGLRRIGDLEPIPRATLARRFGAEVARRLDQAQGALDEPVSPRFPVPPYEERLALAEAMSTAEAITLAVRHLIDRLCARLADEHKGARRLELRVYRTDHGLDSVPQDVTVGTARPVRDPAALMRLFAERLERIAPGPGLELLTLAAPLAEPLAPAQVSLAGAAGFDLGGLDTGAATEDFGALLDRLANRLGEANLRRLVPRQSWLPERSVAGMPPLDPVPALLWPEDRLRPVRLLAPPEAIDVVAPVPDDPPRLFRWRGRTHRVGKAEGPERLCAEWWRREAEPRDYYRVEDMDGRRFWVFRRGLYRPEVPAGWFLHGFFA